MKRKRAFFNELTVVGVFAAVVLIGLVFGAVSAFHNQNAPSNLAPVVSAPTVIDYRAEVGSVMAPFLGQIQSLREGELSEDAGAAIAELAARTQDRLLRIRVPSGERDAHLSFVILLDQWKRIVGGDSDIAGVVESTSEVLMKYRWVTPEDSL